MLFCGHLSDLLVNASKGLHLLSLAASVLSNAVTGIIRCQLLVKHG